jgi:transcriptional regulator GlxA family with amidase domain
MLSNVAVIAYPGVGPFELGVLCEGFGVDRTTHGVPALDFAVCGAERGPIRTSMGFDLQVTHGLDRAAEADLLAVPSCDRIALEAGAVSTDVLDALRAAVDRGARVLSVCSGAFLLGEAGLLDGRRSTTHWMYTDQLSARYPLTQVVPEVLYVDDDPVITSAGSAAGLDACLHIWRKEYGAAVASMVARRMVMAPQRSGGQAQFIQSPVPDAECESFAEVLAWIEENLDADLAVDRLAERALMSSRTFARRFRAETGTTPHLWVTRRRVARAEELLETSDLAIERIASEVGFGNPAAFRYQFSRTRGVSPVEYRRTFRGEASSA